MNVLDKSVINKEIQKSYKIFIFVSLLFYAYFLFLARNNSDNILFVIAVYVVVLAVRTRSFLRDKRFIKENNFKILQAVVCNKTTEGSDEDLYFLHFWCGEKYGSHKIQVNYKKFGAAHEGDLYFIVVYNREKNKAPGFVYPQNSYVLDYELKKLCPYTDTNELSLYVKENPPTVPIIDFNAVYRQADKITDEQKRKILKTGIKNKKYLWMQAISLPVCAVSFIVFFCVFSYIALILALLGLVTFFTSLVMSKRLKENCEFYSYNLYCVIKDRVEYDVDYSNKLAGDVEIKPKKKKEDMAFYRIYSVVRKIILYVMAATCLMVIITSLNEKYEDNRAVIIFGSYLVIFILMLYTRLRHLWILLVSDFFTFIMITSYLDGQKGVVGIFAFLVAVLVLIFAIINIRYFKKKN